MTDTRDRIVAAADDLFYRNGFEHTSFGDVAAVVRISRGNFYHHFKSKDEILDAVIAKRLTDRRAMLDTWEIESRTPEERIRSFIDILLVNGEKIRRHGCPIGTLCSELAKLDHAALGTASELFTLFRSWLRRQFEALGCAADADERAMHLLARTQGIAALFNASGDEDFLRREVSDMYEWLRICANESEGRPGTNTPAATPRISRRNQAGRSRS